MNAAYPRNGMWSILQYMGTTAQVQIGSFAGTGGVDREGMLSWAKCRHLWVGEWLGGG